MHTLRNLDSPNAQLGLLFEAIRRVLAFRGRVTASIFEYESCLERPQGERPRVFCFFSGGVSSFRCSRFGTAALDDGRVLLAAPSLRYVPVIE